VNTQLVERLLAEDLIPVVSTIGADLSAGQAYNINADTAAGAIAAELGAQKIIYLSDVAGLLGDVDDDSSLIRNINAPALEKMVADGATSGGMIPKIAACLAALDNGVRSAHLLDGRLRHVLLLELFTDAGVGTMIVPGARLV
jgi:acetylglutamate kinase